MSTLSVILTKFNMSISNSRFSGLIDITRQPFTFQANEDTFSRRSYPKSFPVAHHAMLFKQLLIGVTKY